MKNSQGFTLIELIVVIAILGTLMAIAVPAFNSVSKSARAAQAKAFSAQINTYVYGKGIMAEMKTGTATYPDPQTSSGDADCKKIKEAALSTSDPASAGVWSDGTAEDTECVWTLEADTDFLVQYLVTTGTFRDYKIGWSDDEGVAYVQTGPSEGSPGVGDLTL